MDKGRSGNYAYRMDWSPNRYAFLSGVGAAFDLSGTSVRMPPHPAPRLPREDRIALAQDWRKIAGDFAVAVRRVHPSR
jgi:hypothetical protein